MKAVMLSIQPKWCEKIASGKKTVEIRKTRPKIETPFKCYIYCTLQGSPEFFEALQNKLGTYEALCKWNRENWGNKKGKVIGDFVCDRIEEIGFSPEMHGKYICRDQSFIEQSCVPFEHMFDYLEDGYGYGWHISDLVIYDKPKELSEFKTKCNGVCVDTKRHIRCSRLYVDGFMCDGTKPITRAPQSWCYVEVQE